MRRDKRHLRNKRRGGGRVRVRVRVGAGEAGSEEAPTAPTQEEEGEG